MATGIQVPVPDVEVRLMKLLNSRYFCCCLNVYGVLKPNKEKKKDLLRENTSSSKAGRDTVERLYLLLVSTTLCIPPKVLRFVVCCMKFSSRLT